MNKLNNPCINVQDSSFVAINSADNNHIKEEKGSYSVSYND